MKATTLLAFLILSTLVPLKSSAQLAFTGGVNYSFLRTGDIIKNKVDTPISSWSFGTYFILHPLVDNTRFSIKNEGYVTTSGYDQQFDKTYKFRFTYFIGSTQVNYSLHKFISVQGGVYVGGLLKARPKNILQTYNEFDFGFLTGFSLFENKRMGIYARFTLGVVPMLKYPRIDEFGNFNGEVKGLQNTNISFGTFINLYNEKINLGL